MTVFKVSKLLVTPHFYFCHHNLMKAHCRVGSKQTPAGRASDVTIKAQNYFRKSKYLKTSNHRTRLQWGRQHTLGHRPMIIFTDHLFSYHDQLAWCCWIVFPQKIVVRKAGNIIFSCPAFHSSSKVSHC